LCGIRARPSFAIVSVAGVDRRLPDRRNTATTEATEITEKTDVALQPS